MSSKLIKQDDSYRNWIQEVSKRFRQSQLKLQSKLTAKCCAFTGYWGEIWMPRKSLMRGEAGFMIRLAKILVMNYLM